MLLVATYLPLFLLWYFWLEGRPPTQEIVISSPLDAVVPFNEVFIVPYLAWFPFTFGTIGYLLVADRSRLAFARLAIVLVAGLTFCLTVYTLWPNTQHLRPATYPRANVFTDVVASLQRFDNPSNVCPSMHVFVSVAVAAALWRMPAVAVRPWLRWGTVALTVLICASTVFLKQHSVVDVAAGVALAAFLVAVAWRVVPAHRAG